MVYDYAKIGYNQIGDEGAIFLSEALITNTTLRTLDLSIFATIIVEENSIYLEGIISISMMLATNKTLAKLDICIDMK